MSYYKLHHRKLHQLLDLLSLLHLPWAFRPHHDLLNVAMLVCTGSLARKQVYKTAEEKRADEKPVPRRTPQNGSPAQQRQAQLKSKTLKGFGQTHSREKDHDRRMREETSLPSPASYDQAPSSLSPAGGCPFPKASRKKPTLDATPSPVDTQPIQGNFPESIQQNCSISSDPVSGKWNTSSVKNYVCS